MTSIGMDRPEVRTQTDFGPPQTLRVCALLDDGISQSDAQETLADYWNQDEASKYNLSIKMVSYSSLPRSIEQFFHWQIGHQVAIRQIPPGCDRMMYFVSRNVLDVAWSVPELYGAPEVLGEVDDYTMTRGYVIDRIASLNQVLMSPWFSPHKVARHETFHMIGCGHDLVMDQCYKHIAEAKWIENRLQDAGCYEKSGVEQFFPSFSNAGDGPILLTRAQANGILGLEKDPSFKRFTDCARYAGLPVDENGKMQVAWAQDWMDRAVAEAHREATQPAIATAAPLGQTPARTSDHLTAISTEAPAASASAAQQAGSRDKQAAVPGPAASLSHADTTVGTQPVAFSAAYLGAAPVSPSSGSSRPRT